MRILAGKYKGKKLISSRDHSIRPTTNRIKEFIFNIIQDYCQQKNVADIFCGSGSLGLESLSRGALNVTFVDKSSHSLEILRKNLRFLNINPLNYSVHKMDAFQFCDHSKDYYDLILMDPPFNYRRLNDLTEQIFLGHLLTEKGILVMQHEITNQLNKNLTSYEIIKQKKIGRSLISFLIYYRSNHVKENSHLSGNV